MTNLFIIILAIFATYGVYACWRESSSNNLKLTMFWCLLISMLLMFCELNGWEQGIFYALFGHSFIALFFVLANREIRDKGRKTQHREAFKRIEFKKVGSNIAHFIVVVPIILILSMLVSLGISELLPWSVVNQLSLSAITLPIIWAALMYLYLYVIKRERFSS